VRELQYTGFLQPIGKRPQKIRERILAIGKRNQTADTLAVFENSNEIQKLDEYPAQGF